MCFAEEHESFNVGKVYFNAESETLIVGKVCFDKQHGRLNLRKVKSLFDEEHDIFIADIVCFREKH